MEAMTTTTLGAITPGEAANEVFDRYADWHNHFSPEVIAEAREYYTASLLMFIPQQAAPIAWAYAQGASRFMQNPDAQKTGKLPSQLLQERDAKDAELQRLRAQVEAMRVAGNRLVGQLGGVLPNLNRHIRPAFTEVSVTIIDAWTASLNPTPTTEQK